MARKKNAVNRRKEKGAKWHRDLERRNFSNARTISRWRTRGKNSLRRAKYAPGSYCVHIQNCRGKIINVAWKRFTYRVCFGILWYTWFKIRRTFCPAIKVKFLLLVELGFFEKLKLESSMFLKEVKDLIMLLEEGKILFWIIYNRWLILLRWIKLYTNFVSPLLHVIGKLKPTCGERKKEKKEALIIQFKVMEIDEKLLTTHP